MDPCRAVGGEGCATHFDSGDLGEELPSSIKPSTCWSRVSPDAATLRQPNAASPHLATMVSPQLESCPHSIGQTEYRTVWHYLLRVNFGNTSPRHPRAATDIMFSVKM